MEHSSALGNLALSLLEFELIGLGDQLGVGVREREKLG